MRCLVLLVSLASLGFSLEVQARDRIRNIEEGCDFLKQQMPLRIDSMSRLLSLKPRAGHVGEDLDALERLRKAEIQELANWATTYRALCK
jgi:hypothetical protein